MDPMATEKEKNALNESSSDLQPDTGLFAGAAQGVDVKVGSWAADADEPLSERDVFIGNEDFYKLLAESASEAGTQPLAVARRPSQGPSRYERLSLIQKVLIAGIVVVASLLLYTWLSSGGGRDAVAPSRSAHQAAPAVSQSPVPGPAPAGLPQPVQEQIQEARSGPLPPQSLSLEVARNLFLQREYDKAQATYDQLCQALPASDQVLRDFLQLEMALCAKEAADLEEASRILVSISQSSSPAVRIVASYHLALLEIQRKRFLRARTRAYNTIALIKAVDFDNDWALAFECNCHFLAAECLTRHILMLSNAETDLPTDLWGSAGAPSDPFGSLNESELRALLNSGSGYWGRGVLDPWIRRLDYQGDQPRWSVTSYGAPIEELMAKFAASAELDIHWAFKETSRSDSGEGAIRQRPVSLHLPAATSHEVVLIAAGCAGLLAYPQDNPGRQKVTIFDPTEYSSLQEHLSFLGQQAIALWQKFVLTFYSDERLANAHFAMGLLQSQIGLSAEAIAEYKLVANRFSQMSLAPFALLHSSKLKANLRDYHGAREDLRQLIEQYPETGIYGQAYLRLADATMEAGLKAEAAQLYQRLYNFGLSSESKTASAFGAARCSYETKAYEEAVKWLTRYIDLAANNQDTDLYSAHFLLGQSHLALGQYEQACNAFEYALAAQSPRELYVEAIAAMVKGHIEQEHFVEALDALEKVSSVALSEEQSVEMLLLKSRILRMLGLADTAIVALRNRAEYVSDPKLNAKISFEVAQCHIAKGDLELARSSLSEILRTAEPGPLAQSTALELADVCLKLGRSAQSISVCLQLLDSDVPPPIKQQALKTLGSAYSQQKDYDKAALALSGQWK